LPTSQLVAQLSGVILSQGNFEKKDLARVLTHALQFPSADDGFNLLGELASVMDEIQSGGFDAFLGGSLVVCAAGGTLREQLNDIDFFVQPRAVTTAPPSRAMDSLVNFVCGRLNGGAGSGGGGPRVIVSAEPGSRREDNVFRAGEGVLLGPFAGTLREVSATLSNGAKLRLQFSLMHPGHDAASIAATIYRSQMGHVVAIDSGAAATPALSRLR